MCQHLVLAAGHLGLDLFENLVISVSHSTTTYGFQGAEADESLSKKRNYDSKIRDDDATWDLDAPLKSENFSTTYNPTRYNIIINNMVAALLLLSRRNGGVYLLCSFS